MNTPHDESLSEVFGSRGFTLIDLAAVAAVLAALAMLVLPALAKGNSGSRTAICLNNHRQLMRAWSLYARDFGDRAPNNYGIVATLAGIMNQTFDNWANNIMTWGVSDLLNPAITTSTTNVAWARNGLLSPYLNTNIAVFKCPSDIYLSPAQRAAGWSARLRSISMNGFLGHFSSNPSDPTFRGVNYLFPNYRQFLMLSDVPQPAHTFVTLDEHPDSINDTYFVNQDATTQWGDLPASYHDGACGFSFADGHSEMHRWLSATSKYPVRFGYSTRPFDAAGRKDFQWYKDRVQFILFR